MEHYLNWSGVRCRIFNVGSYRRQAYATLQQQKMALTTNGINGSSGNVMTPSERDQKGACDADFFDANNKEAATLREQVAETALRDMLRWIDDVDEDDGVADGSSSPNHDGTDSFQRNERIAIFDATNSTNKRRQWILEECTSRTKRKGKTTGVVFVESICDDKELLMENYKFKVSNSPDFEGMSVEASMEDLMKRVKKYEDQYQTIADDSLSYIKVFNLSTKLLVNHIYGRLAKHLVPALMAWHIGSRPIFLVRPGETISGLAMDGEDYVHQGTSIDGQDPRSLDISNKGRKRVMRGDTLGPSGHKFKGELLEFMIEEVHHFLRQRASVQDTMSTGTAMSGIATVRYDAVSPRSTQNETGGTMGSVSPSTEADQYDAGSFPLRVLTSTMPRALDTVAWDATHNISISQMSNLNPLDKGDYVRMELEELRDVYPNFFNALQADPYGTRCAHMLCLFVLNCILVGHFSHTLHDCTAARFPGGECYQDLIRRLASVVIDMEQQVIPTLVVSHVSILQCLMAYFRNTPVENCMSIEVPIHTVIKFEPVQGGGFRETQHSFVSGMEIPGRKGSDLSPWGHNRNNSLPIWGDHL